MTGTVTEAAVVERLVSWFGPAGAAFALVAFVVGFFYRRDILRKANDRKDLIVAFSANAAANVEIARALDALGARLDALGARLGEHEAREVAAFAQIGERVEHGLRAGFHAVALEIRAERKP